MNIVGKKIQELRKKAGLDQIEFAKRAGVGLRFVRELEQGKTKEPFIDLTLAGVSLKAQEMVGKMSIPRVQPKLSVRLAPAYDLVCSRIVIPQELDESALTVNGKKNRIKRNDMELLADSLGIPERIRFVKFAGQKEMLRLRIASSMLPRDLAQSFDKLLIERFGRLELQ